MKIEQRGFWGTIAGLVVLGVSLSITQSGRADSFRTTGEMSVHRQQHTATLLPNGKVLVAGGHEDYGTFSRSTAELYDPATGTWTPTGSMSAERESHTATLLPNGKVLVAGGAHSDNPGFSYFSSAELYDPATGVWTATGSMTTARGRHTATLLTNGKVLVAAGQNAEYGYPDSAELYDPATGTWTAAGSMSSPRAEATATLLSNGKVLVAGGYTWWTGTYLSSAEVYDPATGNWTATGSMSTSRYAHTATLLPNGMVLVAGGITFDGLTHTWFASAELYNPATGTWTMTGSMSAVRSYHSATLLGNGNVLVTGGQDSGYPILYTAEVYNPVTGVWTASGSMNEPRTFQTATLLPNGNVLLAGGYSFHIVYTTATAELYDASWIPAGTMSAARSYHTATLLSNGKVLVTGGTNSGGLSAFLSSAELHDPSAGTWAATTPMSTPRGSHTATLLSSGKVLVAGGDNPTGVFSSAELYDSTTGTWAPTGAMTAARRNHTATLLSNGKVLVAGGNYPVPLVPSAELYDPSSSTWTSTGSMLTTRQGHTATLLANGKVLVAGGYNAISGYLSSAELYDPATGTWTASGSMSAARYVHTATLLPDGKVLVAGGIAAGSTILASAEVYNPASGTWTAAGPMLAARYGHTATLRNGKVLVAGGISSSGVVNSAELYDPSAGTWASTGPMTAPRSFHTATMLSNAKVLVTGGNGSNSILSSAELYVGAGSLRDSVRTHFSYASSGKTINLWTTRTSSNPPDLAWDQTSVVYGRKGFTAIAPRWSADDSLLYGQRPITAISKRHGYMRGHGNGPEGVHTGLTGYKVWFCTANNTRIEVTIQLALTRTSGRDYTVLVFDQDLPDSITPIPVTLQSLMTTTYGCGTSAIYLRTEQAGHVSANNNLCTSACVGCWAQTGHPGYVFPFDGYDTYKGGDSGSPAMLPMPDGALVMFQGSSTSGASAAMQADMDTLSTTQGLNPNNYQLSWYDFSPWILP